MSIYAKDITSFSLGQPSLSIRKDSKQNTVSMRLWHIVLKTMLLKPDYLHQLFGNLVKMQIPVLKIWAGPVILHFQQAPKGYGCC